MKPVIALTYLVVFFGCTAWQGGVEEVQFRVNSYTVDCVGEMEGTCLLVQEGNKIGTEDWEYFYYKDSIVGFEYEAGYIYDLIVRKIPVSNPPMDSSSFGYELVQIISKKKVE